MILWADCETTGLDPATGLLLEVALLATDDRLEALDEGISIVLGHERSAARELMWPHIDTMHDQNGLLDEVEQSEHTTLSAEQACLEYLEHKADCESAPLAGSNIKFDRMWVHRFLPPVLDRVHYRDICVSSLKETCRRFFPKAYRTAPLKGYAHRAAPDLRESLAEYRHYLAALGADVVTQPAAGAVQRN